MWTWAIFSDSWATILRRHPVSGTPSPMAGATLQDGHPLLPQLETWIQDSEQQCAFTEQEDCRCASTFRGCLRPSPVYQFLILVKSGALSLKIQSMELFSDQNPPAVGPNTKRHRCDPQPNFKCPFPGVSKTPGPEIQQPPSTN